MGKAPKLSIVERLMCNKDLKLGDKLNVPEFKQSMGWFGCWDQHQYKVSFVLTKVNSKGLWKTLEKISRS